ncbi:MAG: hypothetical protein Q7T18_08065, partial [Sedimentisphaerales bacterium]|nr:hypothetical protein [Sedimentisphaerales bacterium]
MPKPNRIQVAQVAKPDRIKYFDNANTKVFDLALLVRIYDEQRDFWRLARRMSAAQFIQFLIDYTDLSKIELTFSSKKFLKYAWGTVSIFDVLMSLNSRAYLSHYTAAYIHELTEQI